MRSLRAGRDSLGLHAYPVPGTSEERNKFLPLTDVMSSTPVWGDQPFLTEDNKAKCSEMLGGEASCIGHILAMV